MKVYFFRYRPVVTDAFWSEIGSDEGQKVVTEKKKLNKRKKGKKEFGKKRRERERHIREREREI